MSDTGSQARNSHHAPSRSMQDTNNIQVLDVNTGKVKDDLQSSALLANNIDTSLISGHRSKKSACSHRSKLNKSILAEFQQQMQDLEQAMSKELRIKARKLNKLQRELNDTQDYFRELVFLIEEVI